MPFHSQTKGHGVIEEVSEEMFESNVRCHNTDEGNSKKLVEECGSQNKIIKHMQVNLGTVFSNSLFKGEHFEADYKKNYSV